ncbi:hypothetical protein LRP88_11284 [Fusarium phalaenopsidis]
MPKTTLIITPKSTIYGWEEQIKTHIRPNKIRWITYHGPRRHEVWDDVDSYDIVLTTYDTIRSDRAKSSPLFEKDWARIVLDEAHRIRNRGSKIFQDVCKLQAESRWCLTGTPIQNYLDDFGSLLSFIKVPPFETKDQFDSHIAEPVKQRKGQGLEMLRKVVAATCLRRTKADHAKMLNLPPKTEHVERVEMGRNDRRLYEFFKRFSYLTAGLDKTSKKRAATNILVLISMLRLICDHGEALLPDSALTAWRNRDENALTWEMLESTTKRVIFSFWTKMLDLIGVALEDKGMKFCRIDGQSSMSQRKQAIETFGNDPKIDLVCANSVHIIEPHWNPMAEAQAIDRVHRIGQGQDVDVVRYIMNDSIELVTPPSHERLMTFREKLLEFLE